MTDTQRPNLVKLDDTKYTLSDRADDVRGHKVLDRHGDEIGEVDGLMLDEDEMKVRFLHVAAGGFLGIGEKTFLIPIDAIARIDDTHVHVDETRERVIEGPTYDPELAKEEGFWESSYGHYGYTPFWAPGYAYPAYPFYGAVAPAGPARRRNPL